MKIRLQQFARKYFRPLCFALGFALIGLLILITVRAAVSYITSEPESGQRSGAAVGKDDAASGGKYVRFSGEKPNIVLVLLDDMDDKVLPYMSKAKSLIADQGMTFPNYMYNIAQCCPSRASMFRGQYAHNTGVLDNGGDNGGFNAFYTKNEEQSTMGTWLHDAGYKTGFMGKYLNGYPSIKITDPVTGEKTTLPETYIPPGWDDWYGFTDHYYDGYDYRANDNGKIDIRGHQTQDYGTDVLADHAEQFLDNNATSKDPVFLVVTPTSPHKPYAYADRHKAMFPNAQYPQTPSFDEADTSDKPEEVRDLPRISSIDGEVKKINGAFRDRIRSVQAVDEMVDGLVKKLNAQGKLDNTVFIVASDNGLHMGEHNQTGSEDKSDGDAGDGRPGGKVGPYVEDIRTPMYIRGPGIPAGKTNTKIVSNVDLAPTFADYAGANTPNFVDGRSFAALAAGQDAPWRNSFVIERYGPDRTPYYGIYTDTYSYVHYQNAADEHEVYNLKDDPYQLENQYGKAGAPQTLVNKLEARAKALSTCSGQSCRDIESQPL